MIESEEEFDYRIEIVERSEFGIKSMKGLRPGGESGTGSRIAVSGSGFVTQAESVFLCGLWFFSIFNTGCVVCEEFSP